MSIANDYVIMGIAAGLNLLLFIFAVNWHYFRDWVVVFLFKVLLDSILGAAVVAHGFLEYPVRLYPKVFDNSVIFEYWVFPVLCVLYNQITRERGLWPALYQAALFSAGITAVEYLLVLHTNLVRYINWAWYDSLLSLTATFLVSRAFIAFYRWGCAYFGRDIFRY